MSIFNQYFGIDQDIIKDYTIAPIDTAPEFGKVYVRQTANKLKVQFTILMAPEGQSAEGWQTGIALDASSSMISAFGRELIGQLFNTVTKEYEKKGWIKYEQKDGQRFRIFGKAAVADAVKKGYFKYSNNIVEPTARKFISYLARKLDIDGDTTVIYWACGDGSQYEILGDIRAEDCETLKIQGPKNVTLGEGTQLRPAIEYYCNRFIEAERGMYIFITDGYIDDLETVKQYTTQLAKDIAAGKRKLVKCILIGVGKAVDEKQMIELDDLDTGTEVDIWDHKIADDMRELIEIFAELVDENQIVAPTAAVYGSDGQLIKKFTDGLPAKVVLEFPVNTQWFELQVMGWRIRQSVLQ
jgi:hypothetical protein